MSRIRSNMFNRRTRDNRHGTHGHYLGREAREHVHHLYPGGVETSAAMPEGEYGEPGAGYTEEWATTVGGASGVTWDQISDQGFHGHPHGYQMHTRRGTTGNYGNGSLMRKRRHRRRRKIMHEETDW